MSALLIEARKQLIHTLQHAYAVHLEMLFGDENSPLNAALDKSTGVEKSSTKLLCSPFTVDGDVVAELPGRLELICTSDVDKLMEEIPLAALTELMEEDCIHVRVSNIATKYMPEIVQWAIEQG